MDRTSLPRSEQAAEHPKKVWFCAQKVRFWVCFPVWNMAPKGVVLGAVEVWNWGVCDTPIPPMLSAPIKGAIASWISDPPPICHFAHARIVSRP